MFRKLTFLIFLAALSCSHKKSSVANGRRLASDPLSTPMVQSCVQSICGDPQQNTNLVDAEVLKSQPILYKPGNDTFKKIDEALRQTARASLQSFQRDVQATETLLKQPEFKIPPPILILINGGYFLKLQQKALAQKVGTQVKDLIVSDFTGLSPEDVEWVKRILKTKYFVNVPIYDEKETLYNYLDRKFPQQFFKYSLPKAISICQDQVAGLRRFLGSVEKLFMYCGKSRGVLWNTIDEERLAEELKVSELLTFLRAAPIEKIMLSRHWDWFTALKNYSNSEAFKVAQRVSSKSEDQLQIYVNSTINSCHQWIGSAFETSPSEFLRQRAIANINDAKAKAKTLIQFKDKQVQRRWEKSLASTWYSFPPAATDLEGHILLRLQAEMTDQTLSQGPLSSPARILFNLAFEGDEAPPIIKSSPLKQEMDAVTSALKALRDICKSYEAETLTDHIYASDGNVYLSWFTLKYPDIGYGIIAHELGHHVSHLMKTEFARNRRRSSKDILSPKSIWFQKPCVDHPHAEEDWADFFAGHVLRLKGSTQNFICPLMNEREDQYEGNFEIDLNGKYSPSLFRLLHVEKTAGQLTESCSKILSLKSLPTCF